MPEDKTWKGRVLEDRPKWMLPSPFKMISPGLYEENQWGAQPLTYAEFIMVDLSWTLRSKPGWQRKAADPEIRAKWRAEAMEQAQAAQCRDEKSVDYVLAELDGYAKLVDAETGIERGCFEAIWYSDRLFSNELTDRLKSSVTILENVPDDKKDWHPGSDGQVLDLVHPSLYCIVYGRTQAYIPDQPRILDNLRPVAPPSIKAYSKNWVSKDFSWLPSDFAVDQNGTVKLLSPYINNLHPQEHQALYRVIEEVVAGFVPMWGRVLGDVNREDKPYAWTNSGRMKPVRCIWGDGDARWTTKEPEHLPEANEYNGQLVEHFQPLSLLGRTIQCIVKLANIHLTPEDPEYAGGSWHVEGMVNESIVASGIFYYDEENITESELDFRVATAEPEYHGQDDDQCMRELYNMGRDDECVQYLGGMVTKAGRALAWPNIFQHCVSEFKLADAAKPGHRKILAVFLVDPTIDPIPSASDVPPQQAEWAADALEAAYDDANPHMPRELRDLVKEHFPESVMTFKEAEEFRLRLMEERTAFVDDHTKEAFAHNFSMCEH
ncbi:hypothetical protein HMN09_01197500 [Mycena chlorophos]|uniref:Uncharacterized protein n=1 Tax=Mycena chlorophos TaxID=658473 RepID=A0A8H6S4X0_MYCCL|nr:hypothetical protein HMN09_01197500 [Mycena chlorophos]